MTLPDERTRSVYYAKLLLRDLLDPKKTPKVPKYIRERAYSVLKHFPDMWHIDIAAKHSPSVFGPVPENEENI